MVKGNDLSLFSSKGTVLKCLYRKGQRLPNRHCRGGQSQNRIMRLREEAIEAYIKLAHELALHYFIDAKTSQPSVSGLILAGPGNKKRLLRDVLDQRLKPICLGTLSMDDQDTIQGVVERASTMIQAQDRAEENKALEPFLQAVELQNGLAVYGKKHTLRALRQAMLKEVYLAEEADEKLVDEVNEQAKANGVTIVTFCQLSQAGSAATRMGGQVCGLRWYPADPSEDEYEE